MSSAPLSDIVVEQASASWESRVPPGGVRRADAEPRSHVRRAMSQIATPAPVAYARGRESCHGSSLVAAPTDGVGAEVLRAVPVRTDPVTGEAELVQISRQTLTEDVRAATPPESPPQSR